MRRAVGFGAVVAALIALTAGPAIAQDDGDYGDFTTTTSSTTSTTQPSCDNSIGTVDPPAANPGDEITLHTNDVFEPGTTANIFLVSGQQGSTAQQLGASVAVNEDGTVTFTFTIPAGIEPGIYFVYAEADEDPDCTRSIAVLVVIAAPGGAAAAVAASTDDPVDGIVPPAEVQNLQQTREGERVLLDQVQADDDAELVIDGDRLAVSTEQDTTAPVTAGLAAGALVLVGVLGLRLRRTRA